MKLEITLLAGLGGLLLVSVGACRQLDSNNQSGESTATESPRRATASTRGSELFGMHCAVCHGSEGRGNGLAERYLFPPARDFSGGFRLVSTDNGVPSDADLIATLKRGMPGSAMPSFEWLGSRDLESLARYVRELAIGAVAEDLLLAEVGHGGMSEAAAQAEARRALTPGAKLKAPSASMDLELGRKLYLQNCAVCHADDGRGSAIPHWNEKPELNWARDFTRGFMKGSASREAIAHRIQAGLPGSAMPATSFATPKELASLVSYVRSLIPEGSEYRLVQRRKRILVQRIEPPLPENPNDPAWREAEETLIALSPLWWQDEAVVSASVSALHDGEQFAVRVRWNDETGGPEAIGDENLPDAVALQFSNDSAPPLFGMGSRSNPTTIWHWKSRHMIDRAGALDLRHTGPHSALDGSSHTSISDAGWYELVSPAEELMERVDQVHGQGLGDTRSDPEGSSSVRALAKWVSGEWEAIFVSSFEQANAAAFSPRLGSRIQLALSIWNGDAGDSGGQKSISIWHELEFER